MIIPTLAWRNLIGAGLRTWLNVIVLSFAFVAIIATQGLLEGMNDQAAQAIVDAEYGGGQYWHEAYDRFDPLSLRNAHGKVEGELRTLTDRGDATPLLIVDATLYFKGRMRTVLIKGIDPPQKILSLPSNLLQESAAGIPAMIGSRMARNSGIAEGDYVTLQWRDAKGTIDARDVEVVRVFSSSVQDVDNNQIWLPLRDLQEMTRLAGEATIVAVRKDLRRPPVAGGWTFKTQDELLKDIRDLVRSKTLGSMIVYTLLILLAMLAIFDTQVLSIFRRRKEIGTLMALGMPRGKVIETFTMEGALHGVLAAIVAALYGIPLLAYLAHKGWTLPSNTDSYGFAIGETLFPVFGAALVLGTTLLVLVVTTIVSYLPTRRISRLKPTDALRGRMS